MMRQAAGIPVNFIEFPAFLNRFLGVAKTFITIHDTVWTSPAIAVIGHDYWREIDQGRIVNLLREYKK